MPLGSSLLLHAGIVVFALATYQAVQVARDYVQQQTIIPDSMVIEDAPIGGVINPGSQADFLTDLPQLDPDRSALQASQADELTHAITPSTDGQAPSLIGIGAGNLLGGSKPGTGTGAPFGVPGGGLAPPARFVGISSNARRIVFVCDASGTMMSVFDDLKAELRRSVDRLSPVQAFNVIFFRDDQAMSLSRNELLMATPANKISAFDWISKSVSAGSTNPLPAIRMAFAQQPELIYVLTDGFDNVDNFDQVINEFRRLNPSRRVKVNTILVRSSDDDQLAKVLQTIATDSGGIFKAVDRDSRLR